MKSKKIINYGPLIGLGFLALSVILFFLIKEISYYFFIVGILILLFSKNESKIELRKDIKNKKSNE
jgi:hypothetical protein